MESIPLFLRYLLVGSTGTMCGIFYWMAMENLHEQRFRTFYVFALSLLLTPVGAWVVSTILRLGVQKSS